MTEANMEKKIPIVVCTVHDKCVPVLQKSVNCYAPEAELFVFKGPRTTFGEAYNSALASIFEEHDFAIIANDDIVLTPTSLSKLMADVEALRAQHGDALGIVGAHSDSAFPTQNIRFPNGDAEINRYLCKWPWESAARQESVVAPLFAWISKKAFDAAHFPPINWYSDDVICRDLVAKGFKNFVSCSYVHHVGSQTVGQDFPALRAEAEPWLRANRPALADL